MSNQPHLRNQRLAGKVALVTGAASGIGRAAALLLAGHGSTVTCGDVDLAGAAATAAHASEAGGIASGTQLDVTAEANWEETLREILQRNSRLDVLVNCAGISFGAPVTETSLEDWRRVMAVNLEGVFLGTKHAIVACGRPAAAAASSTFPQPRASKRRRARARTRRARPPWACLPRPWPRSVLSGAIPSASIRSALPA